MTYWLADHIDPYVDVLLEASYQAGRHILEDWTQPASYGILVTAFSAADHHLHVSLTPYLRRADLSNALSALLGYPWQWLRDKVYENEDRLNWIEANIHPLHWLDTETVKSAVLRILNELIPRIHDRINRLRTELLHEETGIVSRLRHDLNELVHVVLDLSRRLDEHFTQDTERHDWLTTEINNLRAALTEMINTAVARLDERITSEIEVARMGLGAALSALASKIASILKWLGITIGAVTLYDMIGLGIDEVMRIVWGPEGEITDEQAKMLEDPPEPYDVHDQVIADLAKQLREKKGPYWDTIKRTTRAVLRPEIKLQPIW